MLYYRTAIDALISAVVGQGHIGRWLWFHICSICVVARKNTGDATWTICFFNLLMVVCTYATRCYQNDQAWESLCRTQAWAADI